MSNDLTSRDGIQPFLCIGLMHGLNVLTKVKGWDGLCVVHMQDHRVEDRQAVQTAFDWLVERHGHCESSGSYGPTIWSHWFGPFRAPDSRLAFIFRTAEDATLFRLFHG